MSELGGNENVIYRLNKLELLAEYHQNVLINGNGKPGITTRMAQAEDWMAARDKADAARESHHWKIYILLLSILAGVIVQYVAPLHK